MSHQINISYNYNHLFFMLQDWIPPNAEGALFTVLSSWSSSKSIVIDVLSSCVSTELACQPGEDDYLPHLPWINSLHCLLFTPKWWQIRESDGSLSGPWNCRQTNRSCLLIVLRVLNTLLTINSQKEKKKTATQAMLWAHTECVVYAIL